jgi:UDP-GlcNAc3NAcA epimerase
VKIVTILGARPQFIKSWAVSDALRRAQISEVIVHTGQHYDECMSGQFFVELGLARPQHHLGVGSGSHGAQTGRMLEAIEGVLINEQPTWVVVYGDTNSTLAGALAAAKLNLPLAHIEAGLRSFNRGMPEEVNRVLTDHVSTLLFCPSHTAADNLTREGIGRGIAVVGDVMQDSLLHFSALAQASSSILKKLNARAEEYYVATLHRADLTDKPERLRRLLDVLDRLALPVYLPMHPRTRAKLEAQGGVPPPKGNLRIIAPLGYLDMLRLVGSCQRVLTDSGGLQKEAYWLGRPCITLRAETEWIETIDAGWNTLVGADADNLDVALAQPMPRDRPNLYGDGRAAEKIVAALNR